MSKKLKISFDRSPGDDAPPLVVIHNPLILSGALLSQVERFGLTSHRKSAGLSGRLLGHQDDFLTMIESYGGGIELVPIAWKP